LCHGPAPERRLAASARAGVGYPGEGEELGASPPVTTSGGLKPCGYYIGCSWIRMINHIHDQLLGRVGKMQVKGADTGLAHNLGGTGAVSAVAVLSQP